MFPRFLRVMLVMSLWSTMQSSSDTELICSPSILGCLCMNLNKISEVEVKPCCEKMPKTLIIRGHQVSNITIDLTRSTCAHMFINLFISNTSLTKFYSAFKGLNNVTSVNIEKNQNLTDFHRLIFEELNPNITDISVEFNSFRTLSRKTFANLPMLTTLRLSDNKIGYIEEQSFSGLRSLNSLYLNGNILTLLTSDVFMGLESLTVLSLINNPLQEPKSSDIFKYLKNLRHLMMSHGTNVDLPGINQLPPKVFFTVKQLRTLNMTSIRIKNLTALTFYGLNELERLDLQGNKLTLIPSGTLQQVPKIWSINLSRNQLACLLTDTFQRLPKLANLDLSYNDLSYISEDVFKDLQRLQTLDLAENNIYVIEKNAFVALQALMIIKLNMIHGQAKSDIQTRFISSPLAKLRNTTKIVGLVEYYGVFKGMNQAAAVEEMFSNGSKIQGRPKSPCPMASTLDTEWGDSSTGSRKYLLIIVGICVVFLLIAFTIIMTYRAWSKRRMGEIALALEVDEKQEMLVNKNYAVNGARVDKPKSNHCRKSINGGSGQENTKEVQAADSSNQRHSNIQLASKAVVVTDHCHSDDDSALTPLGVL